MDNIGRGVIKSQTGLSDLKKQNKAGRCRWRCFVVFYDLVVCHCCVFRTLFICPSVAGHLGFSPDQASTRTVLSPSERPRSWPRRPGRAEGVTSPGQCSDSPAWS